MQHTAAFGRNLVIGIWLVFLIGDVGAAADANVPMTRGRECLAVLDGIGGSATFVELTDGRILHSNGNGQFSISTDRGLTWSSSWTAKDPDGKALGRGESSLVRLSGNAVGYFSRSVFVQPEDPGGHILFFRSDDAGKTWSRPVRVTPVEGPRTAGMNDTALRTSSGRIVLPVYWSWGYGNPEYVNKFDRGIPIGTGGLRNNQWISTNAHFFEERFSMSYVCYSDDDGKTWKRNRGGDLLVVVDHGSYFHYLCEPTVAEVRPGVLLMFMRTNLGRLYQSWSDDNGETWSPPEPTELASSTAPAQIRLIPDSGHLLVVWNQQGEDEIKNGFIRSRLSAAISRTGGGVWEFFQNIESIHEETRVEPGPIAPVRPSSVYYGGRRTPGERDGRHIVALPERYGRFSYPSVLVLKDRVLVGHSNAHYAGKGPETWRVPGRLRVIPLSWFYEGADRFKKNPALDGVFKGY
jgi:hypothetical protein